MNFIIENKVYVLDTFKEKRWRKNKFPGRFEKKLDLSNDADGFGRIGKTFYNPYDRNIVLKKVVDHYLECLRQTRYIQPERKKFCKMYGNGMGSSIIHLLKEKKQESVQDAAINIFGSFVVGRTINT